MNASDRPRSILEKLAAMPHAPASPHALPTGIAALDRVLGGGLPRRRMVECFGPAGCGKTTLALQIAAHSQRAGLNAAFIDADQTFDADYAASLGVEIARMPLVQPAYAEQALEIARTLAASNAVDLVIVDSAAALTPRLEMESDIGSTVPRLQSRVLGNELRKLSSILRRGDCCVLFLNQMRTRADRTAGEAETSAGGPPLKLYAAIRLVMIPAGGTALTIRALKNSLAEGPREVRIEWHSGSGFGGAG